MARKTPQEAALTRQRILEAARHLFYSQGVSTTTLEQIARAAEVTRGAVYWHFADKAALISGLHDQLTLFWTSQVDVLMLEEGISDPLIGLEEGLCKIFALLEYNEVVRETVDIWINQGSFVKELAEARKAVVKGHKEFIAKLDQVYLRAKEKGFLRADLIPHALALDTDAFVVGLIRNWLLDACQVGIRQNIKSIIAMHVTLRRPG